MVHVAARTVGDRIGPYELLSKLGQGGMGEVWEAVLHGPSGFRKSVAIKCLLPQLVSDEGTQRALVREARLGARLQHPNVVGTLGLSEHDGSWVVALEYVQGTSLAGLVRALGPLPPLAVLSVGEQAASGLACAHDAGLVHRDIKPANLLVDLHGIVKVADLGICMLSGETSVSAGTPGYMAPEQRDGHAEPRSDLFSLGATLYRLATGRRPFGRGRGVVGLTDDSSASRRLLQPVDEAVAGLGHVVGRCLQADPERRWSTARELAAALAALRPRQRTGAGTLRDVLHGALPGARSAGLATPSSEAATVLLPAGNVPRPRDRFVGRADELRTLRSQVVAGDERLVVLLGPGGTGKTRLALEVAHRVVGTLAGGTWLLDLTEARSPQGICVAVARGLGVELEGDDPVGQLAQVLLARGRALVLLDNLEQCVDHLPATLGRWLADAPEVVFLCTSRVRLQLRGERVVSLGPLTTADAESLFVERVARALGDDERAEVGPLCAGLDGMPLAIELAAARVGVLGVAGVRARLSLTLLSGGNRELPPRHRSVQASLDWSAELLSESARAGLAQLSVFEGGFSLEASEAVLDLAGAAPALDVLQELVDASLLRVDPREGRFSMLAVVREYGEACAEPAERQACEARHGAHFAQLGTAQAIGALDRAGGSRRRKALAVELENLIVACRRAAGRGDGAVALATLRASWAVLQLQGPIEVAAGLARQVLPVVAAADQGAAELIAGRVDTLCGQSDSARAHLERALHHHRQSGDSHLEGGVHGALADLQRDLGELDAAVVSYEAGLQRVRSAGDVLQEGHLLGNLSEVLFTLGRMDDSRTHLEAALALHREVGNRRLEGQVLGQLGSLYRELGLPDPAREHYEAALVAHREVGNRRGEARLLRDLSILHRTQGRMDAAHTCVVAGLAVVREVGDRRNTGILLGDLATDVADRGDLEGSCRVYLDALAVHREVGNRRFEGITSGNLGNMYLQLGRLDDAEQAYRAALDIHAEVGDVRAQGVVTGNLGLLHSTRGDQDEARNHYEAALAIHRSIAHRRFEGVELLRLGLLHLDQGRDELASEMLHEALEVSRDVGDRRMQGHILSHVARVVDDAAAEALMDEGEALLREVDDPTFLVQLLIARAERRVNRGDLRGAGEALAEARSTLPPGEAGSEREISRVEALLQAAEITDL